MGKGKVTGLGPHETATGLFFDMIMWQSIALQAMQQLQDMCRNEPVQIAVPALRDDVINDPKYLGALGRLTIHEAAEQKIFRLEQRDL